jgi:DNA-binding MarR family transcriptional regulator/GNAT superfamily N-acetyltransferase
MVRDLGFMQPTFAGTGLPASASHAILEIGRRDGLTASDLAAILRLEKSSVSRLLQKLIAAGKVTERVDAGDSRIKRLALTAKGRRAEAQLNAAARGLVSGALKGLPAASAQLILEGLSLYAERLAKPVQRDQPPAPVPVRIVSGYRPGIVGRMIEMQAVYYARTARFGRAFESRRAADIAAFAERLDRPCNQLWCAVHHGRIAGTIAIDGDTLAPDGYLRWFMVDETLQGRGIGKRLMSKALAFCRARRFRRVKLDTFAGLDAARHLYEVAGFELVHEKRIRKWDVALIEQMFALDLRSER